MDHLIWICITKGESEYWNLINSVQRTVERSQINELERVDTTNDTDLASQN
jgi:hypothetical protein